MLRGLVLCVVLCGQAVGVGAAELNGELVWARQVDLSVPVNGRIASVEVTPGSAVETGQILLKFDSRALQARAAQARAVLRDAELHRAEARREWDRAKELFDRTVLSERELQLAENGYASADAQYQAARAALTAIEVDMDYGQLKAPFAAWVLDVHVAAGEAVVNNSIIAPLVTLVARDRMRARIALNAVQIAALQQDAEIEVRVANKAYPGRVALVGLAPQGDVQPALYRVEVEFPVQEGETLRAGQAAVLVLP